MSTVKLEQQYMGFWSVIVAFTDNLTFYSIIIQHNDVIINE